jgi:D-alanyl-D-alanine carboxypeptidase
MTKSFSIQPLLWLIFVSIGFCSCSTISPDNSSKDRTPSQEDSIASIRKEYGLPALAAAEFRDGKMVFSAFDGVRKIGDPTPVQPSDQFHLGSNTKAMTASLIGMLIEDGKLRWDTTLSQIFPNLRIHPGYQNATIEMLLAHRAGLPANVQDKTLWDSLWDPTVGAVVGRKRVLESVLTSPPVSSPGAEYRYSNVGYMILGSVIEEVAKTSWESFIQLRLFEPLKMDSCGFGPAGDPTAAIPDEPWGHTTKDSILIPVFPDLKGDNPPAMNSAARVHCSFADWAKFLQMHVDGFNGKQNLLLKPSTFEKLHTPYPGQEYTYGGWILTKRPWAGGPVLFHEGSNTFSFSQVWIGPLKNTFFIGASNVSNNAARNAVPASIKLMLKSAPAL